MKKKNRSESGHIKHINTCYESLRSKGEKEEKEIFEQIMAMKFPILMKGINLRITKEQQTSNMINAWRTIGRHTTNI